MTNADFQKLVLEELANIKAQGSENSEFVSALMHRTEEMTAQIHNLSSAVDQLTGRVSTIENKLEIVIEKIDILDHRIAAQDGEIRVRWRRGPWLSCSASARFTQGKAFHDRK